MNLNNLKNKRILILGLGKEGIDTLGFLRKLYPAKKIGLADQLEFKKLPEKIREKIRKDEKVKRHFGRGYLQLLKDYGIIVKSPGIPPKTIQPFLKGGQRITSQTEIFFENCPGIIIGITGTKGKSTTASLIYRILKSGGIKAHLVGNIGKPVLSLLFGAKKDDVYVYELSSHQLMNLKKSPKIAVFLNLYREHLDYYRNFNEYIEAKANITLHQKKSDYFVYNSSDPVVKKIARKSKAEKIPIGKFIANTRMPLIGQFNLLNMGAAVAVGKIFGISDEIIKKALKNFRPLPHRLECVGAHKGITFYNDSLATIPEATMAAMNALGRDVETLILGGFERYYDFSRLAEEILRRKIKTVILFPTTGERIWKEIIRLSKKPSELPKHFFVNNMREAVALSYRHTKKGKICLLSCASPSFSIFKDYKERGNLFKKYLKLLAI